MGRDQGDEGDPLLLDDSEQIRGLEGERRMEVHAAAQIDENEGVEGRIDMAKGHDIQAVVIRVEFHFQGIDQIEGDVRFMGADHPLGLARGAGGVNQDPWIGRQDGRHGLFFRRAGNEAFVFTVAVGLSTDDHIVLVGDVGEVFFDRIDDRGELCLHHHGLGVGVIDDIGHFASHQAEIDRYDENAGFGHGQVEFDDFDAIVHEHGDLVALGQTQRREPVGQLVDPPVGLRVGKAALVVRECEFAGVLPRVDFKLLSQIHPVRHVCPPHVCDYAPTRFRMRGDRA
ncbi:hypothetical protein DESC_720192 [Desulfosarcina cetonica]|nr:hypothetical protein DESC_720192 [Desulfosarcina cetonica]